MIELSNSKITQIERGRYSLDAFIGAVQMKEPGGEWQDIRPRLIRDSDGWHIEGAPYFAEIKDDGTRLFCPDRNERSKYIRLPSPDYFSLLIKHIASSPTKIDGQPLNNKIIIPTAWGEYRIIFSNTGMHFEVLFNEAPPTDAFGKDSPRILLDAETAGYDIGQLLKANSGVGIPKPRLIALNSADNQEKRSGWSYKNGQLELNWDFTGLQFPILLKNTTVDEQVGASGDDGGLVGGSSFSTGDTTIRMGQRYGNLYETFHRWTGISIEGTISTAYVEMYAHLPDQGSDTQLKIYGIDEDNPAAPTSAAEFLADPHTTAAIDDDTDWTSGTWNQTPELKTIFQELVNSYTISNDAVMLQFRDDGSPDNNCHEARHYDYSGNTYGAKLHIEYSAAGGLSIPLAMHHYKQIASQ